MKSTQDRGDLLAVGGHCLSWVSKEQVIASNLPQPPIGLCLAVSSLDVLPHGASPILRQSSV